MLLIVGLGNPGKQYAGTRHNIGFQVVEALAERLGPVTWRDKFSARVADVTLPGSRGLLVMPQTFMNRSGDSVRPAAAFFHLEPSRILVIHDELDISFGDVRVKVGGGEAGHNGLKSISQQLGDKNYLRLRVGIGRPPADFRGDVADFVLQAFAPNEQVQVPTVTDRAAAAVLHIAERGVESAMNETNRKN